MKYPETAQLCRDARERTGLSWTKFAALLWTGPRTIANWESGERPPTGPAHRLLIAIRDGLDLESIPRPQ